MIERKKERKRVTSREVGHAKNGSENVFGKFKISYAEVCGHTRTYLEAVWNCVGALRGRGQKGDGGVVGIS